MRPPRSLINKFFLPVLCATGATLAFSSVSGKASELLNDQKSQPASAILSEQPTERATHPSPVVPSEEASPLSEETKGNAPVHFGNKLFAMPLPQDLTPSQRQIALELMQEAEPRLSVLYAQLSTTLEELHNLSFASDTPPDALANLGRKLVTLRKDILSEMRRLSLQMKKKAGFNPGWGTRSCNYAPEETVPPCERFE